MKTNHFTTFFIATVLLCSTFTLAQKPVMVGGAEMSSSKNIVENVSKSKAHKTLVAAVKAAGLVETLSGTGPFTVFAPTDIAFSEWDNTKVSSLMKPENKEALTVFLTYHVVSGKLNASELVALIQKNNGRATLTTVNGGVLKIYLEDGDVYIDDERGRTAAVTIADVPQSNGVVHVIDAVLTQRD